MTMFVARPSDLRLVPVYRIGNQSKSLRKFMLPMMKDGSLTSSDPSNKEDRSNGLHMTPSVPQVSSSPSNLRFDRLQLSDQELDYRHKRAFGRFVAREALLDEEYWTAAWLRAESHWEDRPLVRHVDSYKRKFSEQEFNALKRRCNGLHSEKCTCIIAVKKEERNVKRTVLSSIVGTLDISIKHLLCGETYPGERVKAPIFSSIYQIDQPTYAYVANLCVAKYARRQGIASNMLLLAVEAANSSGANQIFVHVLKDNVAAQQLYDKIGFQMVEIAIPHSLAEHYLLSYKI